MRSQCNGIAAGCALMLTAALSSNARAQETSTYWSHPVAAPSQALELKVGTGYTQGFGDIVPSRPLSDSGGPGVAVGLDVDYRLNPRWSLGIEGQLQSFTTRLNTSATGFSPNVGATYHLAPALRGDPWARLGMGYRLYWERDATGPMGTMGATVLRHGLEILTAKVGYDVRVSKDVALGPVVGADLTLFAWQDSRALSNMQVGTFVYAGLQGRLDVGGARGIHDGAVAEAPPPPPAPPEEPSPVVAESEAPPPTTPASPSIAVSDEILASCKLILGSIDKAPKFEFDKADLLPADLDVLRQIAECFTSGPMKNSGLQLIGRADPRGTVDYNDHLGDRRADNVAAQLSAFGISTDRIEKSSRGERDAVGSDEATWAVDRRVDILQR